MMIFLDMLAGFLVAAMSGLGIGGGGLLVIYLTLLRDVGQLEAQGLNLLFFLFASGASMFIHVRRRSIDYRLLGILVFFGIFGAIAGSASVALFSADVIRKIFGSFLILTGTISLFQKKNA